MAVDVTMDEASLIVRDPAAPSENFSTITPGGQSKFEKGLQAGGGAFNVDETGKLNDIRFNETATTTIASLPGCTLFCNDGDLKFKKPSGTIINITG